MPNYLNSERILKPLFFAKEPLYIWRILLLIPAITALAHIGGVQAPFVYDDQLTIVDNQHIRELERFQEKVGIENVVNRSVTLLTYSVNLALGGLKPFGYHLLNLLLHTLTCICLYFTVRELLVLEADEQKKRWDVLPQYSAILYASHPLATQTVTYLSNRSSLLAAFFSLWTFYIFIRLMNSPPNKTIIKKGILVFSIVILFYLACASKATVAALPLIAVGFLYFRFPKSPRTITKIGSWLLLPLFVYLAYRISYLRWFTNYGGYRPFFDLLPTEPGFDGAKPFNYMLTQFGVVTFNYGGKFFFPIGLNFESDVKLVSNISDLTWITPALALIAISTILLKHPSKTVRFGFIWAVLTIFPTSSFIPLKQLASEHRTYLPLIGIAIIISAFFLNIIQQKKSAIIVFTGYLIFLVLLSANRCLDYRTETALWRDTSLKSPGNPL